MGALAERLRDVVVPDPVAAVTRPGPWQRDAILAQVAVLADRLREEVLQREQRREPPVFAFEHVRQHGLGTLLIPQALGGPDGTLEDVTRLLVELAEGDSNVPHALRLHFNLTALWRVTPVTDFTRRQVDRVLEGKLFGGASTEAGTAKPGVVTTPLIHHGDHYRLNGRKFYATGTAYSDFASITVLNAAGETVTAVLPLDRQGLEVADDWDGMGQRLTASGSLIFHDVRVEEDEVLHASTIGFGLASRHTSAWRQLVLVATAAGIVRALLREITDYVRSKGRAALHSQAERAQDDPFVQHVVGEVAAASHTIDALVFDNARILERGAQALRADDPQAEAIILAGALATAKTQWIVSRLALQTAERAFEAGGASATSASLLLDRHWRNLRTIFSHNPLLQKVRVVGDYHLNGTTTVLESARVF